MRALAIRFVLVVTAALLTAMTPAQTATDDSPPANEVAREKWQRVPDLLAAMAVRDGSTVADIGAGRGFLTVRLAAAVGPSGKVYGVDISPDVLSRLRQRVAKANLTNVAVIEGLRSATIHSRPTPQDRSRHHTAWWSR